MPLFASFKVRISRFSDSEFFHSTAELNHQQIAAMVKWDSPVISADPGTRLDILRHYRDCPRYDKHTVIIIIMSCSAKDGPDINSPPSLLTGKGFRDRMRLKSDLMFTMFTDKYNTRYTILTVLCRRCRRNGVLMRPFTGPVVLFARQPSWSTGAFHGSIVFVTFKRLLKPNTAYTE